MMKEEFEKRIGLVITSEEYEVIEDAYMGLPKSVDKDKFVKIWLQEGGIQDLFDKRLLRVSSLRDQVKHLEAERKEQVRKLEGGGNPKVKYDWGSQREIGAHRRCGNGGGSVMAVGRTDYEERKENRISRYTDRAKKDSGEADAFFGKAHDMAAAIPLGQPILVGHHSEGRDRSYRERIETTQRKSFETAERASYYADKTDCGLKVW
jgi:hypothetical protein